MEGISHFATGSNEIYVTFTGHAANYRLSVDNPHFATQVKNIAAAWQENRPVKVLIEGMNIVSVESP